MHRHGNPNWCKPSVPVPFRLTEFEQQVKELGLSPAEYQGSHQLRNWCLRNASSHYVPEYLLKAWGIKVNEGWGSATEHVPETGEDQV